MKTLTLLVGAALLAVLPSPAAAAPDYTAYVATIEEVTDFLYMDEFCEIALYKVDMQAEAPLRKQALDQAAKDGIDSETASQMFDGAYAVHKQTEEGLQRTLAETLKARFDARDAKAYSAAVTAHFDYFDAKCQAFSQSPRLAAYIAAPTDAYNIDGLMNFLNITNKAFGF